MFGYIRIFKPHMRFCEYDTYKGIYCGLCKYMGKEFGLASRFSLSYDITFLALLGMSMSDCGISAKKERCIAHPFKKSICCHCDEGLEYPAYVSVLLTYHKLRDDIGDKGFKKKLAAFFLMPIVKRAYKKAGNKYPELSKAIEEQMKLQAAAEREKCRSLDRSAEPTASMLGAVFEGIDSDERQQRVLKTMGYQLGRYVFFCDALDDAGDDCKKGGYNPLLLNKGIEKKDKMTKQELSEIRECAKEAVMLSLGEMANAYVLLDIKRYKDILDNIVYLGLRNTFKIIDNEDNIINNKKEQKND